jgi:hypothetical protein
VGWPGRHPLAHNFIPHHAPRRSFRFFPLEPLSRGQTQESREESIRHFPHPNVERVDRVVVELAPIHNLFFEFGDAILQLQKCVVGLPSGIIFRGCKSLPHRRGQRAAGVRFLVYGHGFRVSGTGLGNRLKSAPLLLHVARAHFDDPGDLVVWLLQQNVDVCSTCILAS